MSVRSLVLTSPFSRASATARSRSVCFGPPASRIRSARSRSRFLTRGVSSGVVAWRGIDDEKFAASLGSGSHTRPKGAVVPFISGLGSYIPFSRFFGDFYPLVIPIFFIRLRFESGLGFGSFRLILDATAAFPNRHCTASLPGRANEPPALSAMTFSCANIGYLLSAPEPSIYRDSEASICFVPNTAPRSAVPRKGQGTKVPIAPDRAQKDEYRAKAALECRLIQVRYLADHDARALERWHSTDHRLPDACRWIDPAGGSPRRHLTAFKMDFPYPDLAACGLTSSGRMF